MKKWPDFRLIMGTDRRIPPKPEFFFLGIKNKNVPNMTENIQVAGKIHKNKINIFKQKNRPKS